MPLSDFLLVGMDLYEFQEQICRRVFEKRGGGKHCMFLYKYIMALGLTSLLFVFGLFLDERLHVFYKLVSLFLCDGIVQRDADA